MRFGCKTSYRLVNRGPWLLVLVVRRLTSHNWNHKWLPYSNQCCNTWVKHIKIYTGIIFDKNVIGILPRYTYHDETAINHGLNSSPPGQNGHHFAGNSSRYIFVNEKFCVLTKISLKFVPKGPIDYKSALVQIMAWRRPGDKPLSEPMMVS